MIEFELLHPQMTQEYLGFLPSFLDVNDPRSAKEQLDANYQHGGGWMSLKGMKFNPENQTMTYPGDPVFVPLARTQLRDETILFYDGAFVLILQKDGSFDVSRMD